MTEYDDAAARAQSKIDSMEYFQKATKQHEDGDEKPIPLTVYQAQFIAAIIEAAAKGQLLYVDQLPKVSWFLTKLALGEKFPPGVFTSTGGTPDEYWAAEIEPLPWPTLGGPKSQPDVD